MTPSTSGIPQSMVWIGMAQGPFPSASTGQPWASGGGAQKPGTFSKVTGSNLPPVRGHLSSPASSHLYTQFLMWERPGPPQKGAEPYPSHPYALPASLPGCVPMAWLSRNSSSSAADLEDALGTLPDQSCSPREVCVFLWARTGSGQCLTKGL